MTHYMLMSRNADVLASYATSAEAIAAYERMLSVEPETADEIDVVEYDGQKARLVEW